MKREPNRHSAYPRTRAYNSGPFRPSWLVQYPWLHYSLFCDGAFRRACALFAQDRAGGQVVGRFVNKSFKPWSQKMTNHGSLAYHLAACTKMHQFLATYEELSKSINTQIVSQAQKQCEENQLVIKSLLKVNMLLGRQALAFRGHREDKLVLIDQSDQDSNNQGNFIELVHFRAETDIVLARHLKNAPKSAKYMSKTLVGNQIRFEIINEIIPAKFYSITSAKMIQ